MKGLVMASWAALALCGASCRPAPVSMRPQNVVTQFQPTKSVATIADLDRVRGSNPRGPRDLSGMTCLSNGVIGLNLAGWDGTDEASGWATLWLAGETTKEGTESLLRFTNPLGLSWRTSETGQPTFFPSSAILALDTESGQYTVETKSRDFSIKAQLVLSPRAPVLAERLTFTGTPGRKIVLELGPGEDFVAWSPDLKAGALSTVRHTMTDSLDGRQSATLGPGGTLRVERVHSYDGAPKAATFDDLAAQARAWASGPTAPRIKIDGPVDDQQFVNSALFHVRSGVNPKGPTGPFGLTNPRYGGRAFWDSDIWMFPALALLDPERAKSIPQFRLDTRRAARVGFLDWAKAGQIPLQGSDLGYKYPWEAGPTGKENAPEESQRQHHVSGSVARCLWQAKALGLVPAKEADDVISGIAKFFALRSTKNPDGTLGVHSTMSPDEFAKDVDNDLYTNVLAEQTMAGFSETAPPKARFNRPRDATTFLTYDGDSLRSYKQAAALLALWPLQDPDCEKEAERMLDRFAGKSTRNGPAMSQSVEALVRARFGDTDQAYQEWRNSWKRYTKRPLLMFSEAPNGKNAYFLTGAAGCLDAVLYGFVGLRIDRREPVDATWKTPLRDGAWLGCTPRLPQAWKSVEIDNLTVLGRRYRLTVTGQTVTVTPR